MKVLATLFPWLLCLSGLSQGSVCMKKYFHIGKGVRISGTPKTESTVNDEIVCAMLCGRDENCGCCNIIKDEIQLMCQLFDNKVCGGQDNTIKDDRTTVYSVFDVNETQESSNNEDTPKLNSTTLSSTPAQMTSSTITPALSSSIMTLSTTSVGQNTVPAVACKKIYQDDPSSLDDAYSLPELTEKVFCDMTGAQTGCGGGGWTLVMRINGQSATFAYDSNRWTNRNAYQPYYARSLSGNEESKAATYWTTSFTQMCLGMSYNNKVGWIIINMTGSSLFDLISSNSHHATNITVGEWKKLISSETGQQAALQPNCRVQGINAKRGDTGVRIGIIATKICDQSSHYNSRLGFGAKGNSCGQDQTSSCGNEARCHSGQDISLKTFGYVLVK